MGKEPCEGQRHPFLGAAGPFLFVHLLDQAGGEMPLDNNQFQELTKQVMDLRLDLARIDTKMDGLKDLSYSVAALDKRVTTAEVNADSAHNRMNKIERIHAWLATGFSGAIIVAIATFIIKGGLVK